MSQSRKNIMERLAVCKFEEKGLILMISLWILALISLLSLGLAHRVSVNLKSVRFQRDKMKCLYIAKAGIAKAVSILETDSSPQTDSLGELWSKGFDNEFQGASYIFKDIALGDGIFTISYIFDDTNIGSPIYFYGMSDEERKININTADINLLVSLFKVINVTDAESLAEAITFWRGDNPEAEDAYYNSAEIPYPARKSPFKTIEELSLVKGFRGDWDLIDKCQRFLTVYTSDLINININTASKEILKAIFMGLGIEEEVSAGAAFCDKLVNNIIDFRDGEDNTPATDDDVAITLADIAAVLKNGLTNNDEISWIEKPQNFPFTVVSNLFRIEVWAKLNSNMIEKKIVAVVNRAQEFKFKYWHEE